MSVHSTQRVSREYARVLSNVFAFMLGCGLGKGQVSEMSTRALKKAKPIRTLHEKDLSGFLAAAALVLDSWHRNRTYLNRKAEPRAIKLLGPKPSVENLIRMQGGQHNPEGMARRLESHHLIVSCGSGLYRPAGTVALLSAFDRIALQHVARSLLMLFETIRKNLACRKSAEKLIERIAEVPNLPVELIPAFREFTRIQGWTVIRMVNDWLELRRAISKGAMTVRAGVHVHAYVGKPSTQKHR